MTESIKIHGNLIRPAKVNGSPDVFTSPLFSLVKADWEPDDNKSHCELCSTKFTQLKRRHHCRMCGMLRCSKCCNQKLPLPQLSLEEAERVCDSCQAVAELILKSRSHSRDVLVEAASGLANFANHTKHIAKLLELGGLQTLVTLSLTENRSVLRHVVSGLHSLTRHPGIHQWLADSGGIKALCKILSTITDQDQQIALDGIGALMIFCKSTQFKTKVLDDGGLSPVLDLCWSSDDAISLLSLRTLSLIAEHPDTHTAIIEDKRNSVSLLLKLVQSEDEQIQEVSLKTLAFLSTGTTVHRQRVLQEDTNSDRTLLKTLEASPNNPQILSNAACLIANLAVHEENQPSIQVFMDCVCKKLPTAVSNTELLGHLTRFLANCAQYKQHTRRLIEVIPSAVNHCLKSSIEDVKLQTVKFILTLLTHEPSKVAALLNTDGSGPLLSSIGKIPGLTGVMKSSLSNGAPDTVKPFCY